MKKLEMKSKCTKMIDFKTIDLHQFATPINIPEDVVRKQVIKFLTKYSNSVDADEIENRDVVVVTCKSENPRFNKGHMNVRVGLGLLTKEFENQLIGLKLNEEATLTVKDMLVEVKIESIVRDVLPELTDDFVKTCGLPTVSTAKELEAYTLTTVFDEELEEAADDAAAYLGQTFFGSCEYDLDEDELAQTILITEESFGSSGADLTGMKDFLKEIGKSTLESATVGKIIMKQYGMEFSEERYKKYIENKAKSSECSAKEAMIKEPENIYVMNECADFILTLFENYAIQKLIEYGREEK